MRNLMGALVVILVLTLPATSFAAGDGYFTDTGRLNREQEILYNKARSLNDTLMFQPSKLKEAKLTISEFLASENKFLPIYFEKARYTIMEGSLERRNIRKTGEEALKIIRFIQEQAPKYAQPYVLAGHILTYLGDYTNAEKSLKNAQKLNSKDPWLYSNWASLLKRQSRNNEAMLYILEAFKLAGENRKALSASVQELSGLRGKVSQQISAEELLDLILKTYPAPETRLFIAEYFTKSFTGDNPETFYIAGKIIAKVREQSPDMQHIDLEDARLILAKGYLIDENHIATYKPGTIPKARKLLMPLIENAELRMDAYDMIFDLYLSEGNFKEAADFLTTPQFHQHVTREFLQRKSGKLALVQGKYKLAAHFFEEVAKTDPSMKYAPGLIHAYSQTGQSDKVEEYWMRTVEWDPQSAWANGNLAAHCLYTNGDYNKAIKYARNALEIMQYPHAQQTLAMALYLKWADIVLKQDNLKKAHPYFEEAQMIIPDIEYAREIAKKAAALRPILMAFKNTGMLPE